MGLTGPSKTVIVKPARAPSEAPAPKPTPEPKKEPVPA